MDLNDWGSCRPMLAKKRPTGSLSLSLSQWQILSVQVFAETRDRTGDLQIFSLTLSQLSYRGDAT